MEKEEIKQEIEHLEDLVRYTDLLLEKLYTDLDLATPDDYELYYSVAMQKESYLQYIEDLENKLEEE